MKNLLVDSVVLHLLELRREYLHHITLLYRFDIEFVSASLGPWGKSLVRSMYNQLTILAKLELCSLRRARTARETYFIWSSGYSCNL